MTVPTQILNDLDAWAQSRYDAGQQAQADLDADQLAELTQELADTKAAASATINNLTIQVATLQAALDKCQGEPDPTPVPTKALKGLNFIPTTVQTQEKVAEAARIYVDTGRTDIRQEPEFVRAMDNGIKVVILSSKETSRIPAWYKTIPSGVTWYGVNHHEPEDDIAESGFTLAQWKTWQTDHMAAIKAAGGIRTRMLMTYTTDPASGRKVTDYDMAGTFDVAGWDLYPTSLNGQAAYINRLKAANKAGGFSRYLIGEYGVDRANQTLAVSLINAAKPLLADAEVRAYWSQTKSPRDYRLTDAMATAWFTD
jgi:hypothetical protein